MSNSSIKELILKSSRANPTQTVMERNRVVSLPQKEGSGTKPNFLRKRDPPIRTKSLTIRVFSKRKEALYSVVIVKVSKPKKRRNLSAKGSRNFPNFVSDFKSLAKKPSRASVRARTKNRIADNLSSSLKASKKTQGEKKSLMRERVFGKLLTLVLI